MAVAPKRFQSADSGAPALSGTVGTMLNVLDACLCINKQITAISGTSFVDNSTEARLQAGTAFKLFQGPTQSNDEAYFGMSQKFEQIIFTFGTAGVEASTITLAWEYWNGSTWAAFTPDTDGTTRFTANGTVAWTITNLSGWATTSVNSVTLFWVRVRFTAGSWTTNPLVNTSVWACTRAFSGTNIAAYQMGAGNALYLRVDDSGPGAGGAKEGRIVSYETMSDVNTGTKPSPTVAQAANGTFFRKSTTADGTARTWQVFCDDRTFRVYVLTGDTGGVYYAFTHGDFYSKVPSDPYRVLITGRTTENSSGTTIEGLFTIVSALGSSSQVNWVQRDYQGSVSGAVTVGKHTDSIKGSTAFIGVVPYLNGPDGGIYIAPVWIHENAASQIRGRLRGLWQFLHAAANVNDGDTFSGTASDGLSGRTFVVVKLVLTSSGATGVAIEETSNTWETN
jgi:hypothetical protein